MKHFITICFLLIGLHSFSQTKDTITLAYTSVRNYELDFTTIKKIQRPVKQDFEGSYHFGDSEGESQLEILYSNGRFYARTNYVDWEKEAWIAVLERLTISHANEKITINNTNYTLATSENEKGLISQFYEKGEGKTMRFIQFNPDGVLEKPKGKYPETGFVKLTVNDLEGVSKFDLKRMRNELFARKGYVFKKGGEMEAYFSDIEWYVAIPENGALDFNSIEKHNIQLITKLEKENTSNSKSQNDFKFRDTIPINYKEHKALLTILKTLPNTTMTSWEWSKEDRAKTVHFIEKNNYVIDSTKIYNNIQYIKPNTIGIQVVGGFWTLSTYQFDEDHYFIVTNDIVGDGNDIQTYVYINNQIMPTKMINWFSDFDTKLLSSNSTNCVELLENNALNYDYDFSDTDLIKISSWSLSKENSNNCFNGNTITYKRNRAAKTFDIVNVYWENKDSE